MSLSLYKRTIILKPSQDYNFIIFVIFAYSIFMLIGSGMLLIFKICGCIFLLAQGLILRKKACPNNCSSLSFLNGHWIINTSQELCSEYSKLKILIEFGLGFVILFYSDTNKKTIIIFFDQITVDDKRFIRILEKIN